MKRFLCLLLTAVMVLGLLPATIFAAGTEDAGLGTVRVIVENNTCPKDDPSNWEKGATRWSGTLLDKQVPLKADSTVMSCFVEALGTEHTQKGAETGVIQVVDGLKNTTGGWMGTINDWFTDQTFDAFTVKNHTLEAGDEICISYTMDYGPDLGSIPKDTTKTLKALQVSGGTLAQPFTSENHSYQIALDGGNSSGTLQFVPTAYNKNFQVRTYKGETYQADQKGFKRNAPISVKVGDKLQIVVGDPKWPSMSNGAYGGAEKVPAGVYTFEVTGQTATWPVTFVITPEETAKAALITLKNSAGMEMTGKDGVYDLPAGDYTYRVQAPGYDAVFGKITVKDGAQTVPVKLVLGRHHQD